MKNPGILVAFNSFKECADSLTVNNLFADALKYYIESEPVVLPLSDGGDGFRKIFCQNKNAITKNYLLPRVYDNTSFFTPVNYLPDLKTVVIESAEIIGLKLVPLQRRNTIKFNSLPLGVLLKEISKENVNDEFTVNEVILGIGGTATNDLGLGAASVFGLKLFASEHELDVIPENFCHVNKIIFPNEQLPYKITCITDVKVALTGDKSCTKIFSPQKGASFSDVVKMENGFRNIIKIMQKTNHFISGTEEYGAGGGLAVGLSLLGNTEIEYSETFILNTLGAAEKISASDIVITGEGRFDEQSFLNKATGIMLREAEKNNKKIYLICGSFQPEVYHKLPACVTPISLSSYYSSDRETIINFRQALKKAAFQVVNML